MFRYSLEAVVFLAGACVMILELTGSRLLAPYLGTSIYVWTSLIGVILGCLSLGYWLGGRLADRHPRPSVLAVVLLVSALWMGFLSVAADRAIIVTLERVEDLRLGATLVSLLLFGVPSVLLAMVSPYAARLKMVSVSHSGTTVGSLYALSTLGSILGTFLAGFVLVAYFSNPAILRLLFGALVVTSFLASARALWALRGGLTLGVGALVAFPPAAFTPDMLRHVVDVNTLYTRAWIFDRDMEVKGEMRATRFLRLGIENSGAMFLNYWGNVFNYLDYFDLCRQFNPGFRRALMIGGGSYTYPGLYLYEYPEATMDVVEIDPKVTEIARRYFYLHDDPRLRIFTEDGRVFLNRNREQYDVLFLDAFKSFFYIPHYLATVEAVREMDRALAPNGVVLVNLLCKMEGPGSELFRTMVATFRTVFPQVLVFAVKDPGNGRVGQNVVLVALKSEAPPPLHSSDPYLEELLGHRWTRPIPGGAVPFRDAFAPVEHLVQKEFPHSWNTVDGWLLRRTDIRKAQPVDPETYAPRPASSGSAAGT